MKNFKEWINEVARWKYSNWKRPPTDALLRLEKYNMNGYYCHFSETNNKLGINPKTTHEDTPYGIYAYEVNYVVTNHMRNLPWAGSYPFIWVFKAKNPEKIKKIRKAKKYAPVNVGMTNSSRNLNEAGMLWIQATLETESDFAMTKWFLDRGIEGFVDEGTGTIYASEPHQAVFFGSQTIIPLDIFKNIETELDGIKKYDDEEEEEEEDYEEEDPWNL